MIQISYYIMTEKKMIKKIKTPSDKIGSTISTRVQN